MDKRQRLSGNCRTQQCCPFSRNGSFSTFKRPHFHLASLLYFLFATVVCPLSMADEYNQIGSASCLAPFSSRSAPFSSSLDRLGRRLEPASDRKYGNHYRNYKYQHPKSDVKSEAASSAVGARSSHRGPPRSAARSASPRPRSPRPHSPRRRRGGAASSPGAPPVAAESVGGPSASRSASTGAASPTSDASAGAASDGSPPPWAFVRIRLLGHPALSPPFRLLLSQPFSVLFSRFEKIRGIGKAARRSDKGSTSKDRVAYSLNGKRVRRAQTLLSAGIKPKQDVIIDAATFGLNSPLPSDWPPKAALAASSRPGVSSVASAVVHADAPSKVSTATRASDHAVSLRAAPTPADDQEYASVASAPDASHGQADEGFDYVERFPPKNLRQAATQTGTHRKPSATPLPLSAVNVSDDFVELPPGPRSPPPRGKPSIPQSPQAYTPKHAKADFPLSFTLPGNFASTAQSSSSAILHVNPDISFAPVFDTIAQLLKLKTSDLTFHWKIGILHPTDVPKRLGMKPNENIKVELSTGLSMPSRSSPATTKAIDSTGGLVPRSDVQSWTIAEHKLAQKDDWNRKGSFAGVQESADVRRVRGVAASRERHKPIERPPMIDDGPLSATESIGKLTDNIEYENDQEDMLDEMFLRSKPAPKGQEIMLRIVGSSNLALSSSSLDEHSYLLRPSSRISRSVLHYLEAEQLRPIDVRFFFEGCVPVDSDATIRELIESYNALIQLTPESPDIANYIAGYTPKADNPQERSDRSGQGADTAGAVDGYQPEQHRPRVPIDTDSVKSLTLRAIRTFDLFVVIRVRLNGHTLVQPYRVAMSVSLAVPLAHFAETREVDLNSAAIVVDGTDRIFVRSSPAQLKWQPNEVKEINILDPAPEIMETSRQVSLIRVRLADQSVSTPFASLRFLLPRGLPLRGVLRRAVENMGLEQYSESIVYSYAGKPVSETLTPSELDMTVYKEGGAQIKTLHEEGREEPRHDVDHKSDRQENVVSISFDAPNSRNAMHHPSVVSVILRWAGDSDSRSAPAAEHRYNITWTTKLGKIFRHFLLASRLQRDVDSWGFSWGGRRIRPDETPEEVPLERVGCVIDVGPKVGDGSARSGIAAAPRLSFELQHDVPNVLEDEKQLHTPHATPNTPIRIFIRLLGEAPKKIETREEAAAVPDSPSESNSESAAVANELNPMVAPPPTDKAEEVKSFHFSAHKSLFDYAEALLGDSEPADLLPPPSAPPDRRPPPSKLPPPPAPAAAPAPALAAVAKPTKKTDGSDARRQAVVKLDSVFSMSPHSPFSRLFSAFVADKKLDPVATIFVTKNQMQVVKWTDTPAKLHLNYQAVILYAIPASWMVPAGSSNE
eukprot:GHVT01045104.1.p1 GENE.GHVT01045104.1~~GHVT01045104.1.p1  ORF type:complete len:1351 (+),score=252.53 GHVT01045104.1:563-4615(+)